MEIQNIVNRQWTLNTRPVHKVEHSNFQYEEKEIAEPSEGQILLKTHYLNIAPVMRMYMMADGGGYSTEKILQIGDVIHGRGVAEVIASKHPDFSVGEFVQGQIGWQTYKLSSVTPKEKLRKMSPRGLPIFYGLSALGMTGYSAYCGFISRGEPKAGEAVLVSGAAGGVGSLVVQIAKAKGCHPVIGIAGGPEKCEIVKQLGADNTIDYKNENVEERIAALMPEGLDVFFDNVGGEILDAALNHLKRYARIVLCGGISEYTREEPFGPKNYGKLRMKAADFRGFFVYYHADEFDEAEAEIATLIKSKKLRVIIDQKEGFDKMPGALIGMFEGNNKGKSIVKVSEGEPVIF